MEYLESLLQYLAFTLVEGDWLNDYAADFPLEARDTIISMGRGMWNLLEFLNYVSICITDGDWLNDHVVSFPEGITREIIIEIGMSIADMFGN